MGIFVFLLWDDLRLRKLYEAKIFDYHQLAITNATCQVKVEWGICIKPKDNYDCVRLLHPITVLCGKIINTKTLGCDRDIKNPNLIQCTNQFEVEQRQEKPAE